MQRWQGLVRVLPRPYLVNWSFHYMAPNNNKTRSRAWCWTLNNYTPEEETKLQALEVRYLIYGREVGDSGTKHLQGYVYFENKKSFRQVKATISPRAHLEKAKGSAKENIAYCSKDGDVYERGLPPKGSGTTQDRAERNKLLLSTPLTELVDSGDVSVFSIPTLQKARDIMARQGTTYTHPHCRGVWVYGPPGTGKSHWAYERFGASLFEKAQNKWWDGYAGEENILLDDFDCAVLGHYIKRWADKWPVSGEVKGSTIALAYKRFIITSNYLPSDLWSEDDAMRKAIERRFVFKQMLVRYAVDGQDREDAKEYE